MAARVQELEVWTPGERELMLLCAYPSVHTFFVDAVECGELGHDGCGHGRCQLAGSHIVLSRHRFPPPPDSSVVKSICSSRYVP